MREPIEYYVRFKSVELYRVGGNYYLDACGLSYKVTKEDKDQLLMELEDKGFDNPISASLYLLGEITRFERA